MFGLIRSDGTFRSETLAGRNFHGSAQPRNFYISRE